MGSRRFGGVRILSILLSVGEFFFLGFAILTRAAKVDGGFWLEDKMLIALLQS